MVGIIKYLWLLLARGEWLFEFTGQRLAQLFDSGLTFNLYDNVIPVNLETTNPNFLNFVAARGIRGCDADVASFPRLEKRLVDHGKGPSFARADAGQLDITGQRESRCLIRRWRIGRRSGQADRGGEERIFPAGPPLKSAFVHDELVAGRNHFGFRGR